MTTSALPAHVRELVHDAVGEVQAVSALVGSHGEVRAWRIEAARGPIVARWARSVRTARQEAAALRALRTAPGAGRRVPELIATSADAVLVTWVPGEVWSGVTSLPAVVERVAWLHGVAFDDADRVDLAAAVEMRTLALATSMESVAPEDAVWLRGLAGDGLACFRGRTRVWCHGDLRRDNVIVDDGVIGLIDFEHARGDDPAFDVARLELDLGLPQAGRALDGLWQGLDEPGRRLARAMVACATLMWGRTHADAAFEGAGRRQIRALRWR